MDAVAADQIRREQVIEPRNRTTRVSTPANSGAVDSSSQSRSSERGVPRSAAATNVLIVSW